jgi:replicative DNA helicase
MKVVESGVVTEEMEKSDRKINVWKAGVHYVHCPGWSARRIANYARMMKRKGKCDLVIVDYLQKIRLFYRKGWTPELALADVAEVFKNSAEIFGIPYILGSQMNRASKEEKRRTSSGIRGSGQIEERSNLAITLNRAILDEDFVNPETGEVLAEEGGRHPVTDVRVDKNTFGPTGDTQLWMQGNRFTFYDVDKTYLDEIGYGQ